MEEKLQQDQREDSSDLNLVLNERRAERIIEMFSYSNEDNTYRNPILVMIYDWYEEYASNPCSKDFIEYQMFEREVNLILKVNCLTMTIRHT